MGRAQNTTVASTRFDAIFGNRRGHGMPDISGLTLTSSGNEKVERLLKMASGENFEDLLPELYHCAQHLDDLDANPHINRVVLALAEAAIRQEGDWTPVARGMLAMSGAVPYHKPKGAPLHAAQHLVKRESSKGRDILHIWPDGHKVQGDRDPASAIPMWSATLCGKDMMGRIWTRAECGSWKSAERGQEENTGICKKCAELNRESPLRDTEEDPGLRFFLAPTTTAAHDRAVRRIAEDITHAIQTHQETKETKGSIGASLREVTTGTVAQICIDRGGWTLQNLLPFDRCVALSEVDGIQLDPEAYERWSKMLTVDDWQASLGSGFDVPPRTVAAAISQRLHDRVLPNRN